MTPRSTSSVTTTSPPSPPPAVSTPARKSRARGRSTRECHRAQPLTSTLAERRSDHFGGEPENPPPQVPIPLSPSGSRQCIGRSPFSAPSVSWLVAHGSRSRLIGSISCETPRLPQGEKALVPGPEPSPVFHHTPPLGARSALVMRVIVNRKAAICSVAETESRFGERPDLLGSQEVLEPT